MDARSPLWQLLLLLILMVPMSASAQVFMFTPSQDNSIFEPLSPGQCDPGLSPPLDCKSSGSGPHFFSNAIVPIRRGLIQFDLSSISPGSDVTSVELTLHTSLVDNVTGTGTGTLHRLLQDWGEAGSNSGTGTTGSSAGGGQGDDAENGDATWVYRKIVVDLGVQIGGPFTWSAVGGSFVSTPSGMATTPADDFPQDDFVTFVSTAGMVADVQAWVDGTLANNGWLVDTVSGGERWDSKEHPTEAFRPFLAVTVPEPAGGSAAIAALLTLLAARISRGRRAR